MGADTMRFVLGFGLVLSLLIVWGDFANAAKVHRPKPPESRSRQDQPVAATVPNSYAVPGWSDQQTRTWLDDATGPKD
jgi:hypothetical protein